MNKSKFYITEDNKYRWENSFMMIEYSDPSITGYNDYCKINEKEIMYYYYILKIYNKTEEYVNEDDLDSEETYYKYNLVGERYVYDFPCIEEFKCILKYILDDDVRIGGQRNEMASGDIRYSKTLYTDGFACDDMYEITKDVDKNNNDERYTLYIGTTFDCQGDRNSNGIRTPYLDREDIETLLKCINEFISYSINIHNEDLEKYRDKYKIKCNTLYEYAFNEEYTELNKEKFENIYSINDVLENIIIVIDNKEYEYDDIKIINIDDNYVYLERNIKLNPNDIRFTSIEYEKDNKVYFNEEEIKNDFKNVLSEKDKKEFKKYDIDKLYYKYGEVICNRTAMCREEHLYKNNRIENKTGYEAIENIIKYIIKEIKESL